ncbi:lipopolysaccharide biosynthesis protein [Phocaeicola sp.]
MGKFIGSGKTVIFNTSYLYIRMLLMMFISLYTSRLVLKNLGVSDFGIYGIVGSVVTFFNVISSNLRGASQRFISFELGKGHNISVTFTSLLFIHVLLVLVIILFAETIGVYYLDYYIQIPSNRLDAAYWTFQFSILTLLLNILSIPYLALIISSEKMKIFAYIGIVEATMKLFFVYSLSFWKYDKLIIYSCLLFLIQVFIQILYISICIKHFKQISYSLIIRKQVIKGIFRFLGWNSIGTFSVVLREQGINILFNIFFGVIVNAARQITVQVQSSLQLFVTNFMTALEPYITKLYSSRNIEQMSEWVYRGCKISYILFLLLSLPVFVETKYVLDLWLDNYPEYTNLFVKLVILFQLFKTFQSPLSIAILATGKIKKYHLIMGVFNGGIFIVSFYAFKLGLPSYSTFVVSIVISLLLLYCICRIYSSMFKKNSIDFYRVVFFKMLILSIPPLLIVYAINMSLPSSFLRFFIIVITSSLSIIICTYLWGLNSQEKLFIRNGFYSVYGKYLKAK